jgi:hypothetical protein
MKYIKTKKRVAPFPQPPQIYFIPFIARLFLLKSYKNKLIYYSIYREIEWIANAKDV